MGVGIGQLPHTSYSQWDIGRQGGAVLIGLLLSPPFHHNAVPLCVSYTKAQFMFSKDNLTNFTKPHTNDIYTVLPKFSRIIRIIELWLIVPQESSSGEGTTNVPRLDPIPNDDDEFTARSLRGCKTFGWHCCQCLLILYLLIYSCAMFSLLAYFN